MEKEEWKSGMMVEDGQILDFISEIDEAIATKLCTGTEVIALVPVATNTSHWKKCVFGVADAVCFLYDTRLRFLENGNDTGKGAPMACCLIYWGDDVEGFKENFMQYGAVTDIRDLKKVPIGIDVFVQEFEFV